ncbi:MAG: hypothetical protein EPN53_14315 [Acidobacteria bacterium]|nr:MAG: hypothetical protein EPN53_14315 [Acidobacteriota bacterium]
MDWIHDEEGNVPFFGTRGELDALSDLVTNCLKVLREASRPREMVLETWLTVDYAVRQFLLSGFELSRFCSQSFDLRYRLLPRQFPNLLRLLRVTVEFNVALPPAPPDTAGFRANHEFWRFVNDRAPELPQRIKEVELEYVRSKSPDMSASPTVKAPPDLSTNEPMVARLKPEWVEVAKALDQRWFALAEQLNRARNVAVHSFRSEDIGREFGLAGPRVVTLTREKCLEILQTLLAIKVGAPSG